MTTDQVTILGGTLPLVCPRDHEPLTRADNRLFCPHGHSYAVADGIPILLTDAEITHWEFRCLEPEEVAKDLAHDRDVRSRHYEIDPDVDRGVVWSSGHLYRSMLNKLQRYPIPEIRLPAGNGKLLLDIGSFWGRWSIAAARKGYRVVGVDPSLHSSLCARRVAKQLGIDAEFIVADSRYLPFRDNSLDTVFSYSVLQHLAPKDAWASVSEAGRVLKPGGTSLIQLANCFGIRSLYHQVRRGFGDAGFFGVRYYTPRRMMKEMQQRIGPTRLSVDGFLGLGIQPADRDLMPMFERTIISTSEGLRRLSEAIPPLKLLADSLYLESRSATQQRTQ